MPARHVRHRAGAAVPGAPPGRVAPGGAVPGPLGQAAAGEGGNAPHPHCFFIVLFRSHKYDIELHTSQYVNSHALALR